MIKKLAIRLLLIYNTLHTKLQILSLYWGDFKYNLKNHRATCAESVDKSRANIMLVMHALEKGISFTVKKESYGRDKAIDLVHKLERHISQYGVDDQVVSATNILAEYLKDPHSTKDSNCREKIRIFLSERAQLIHENIGGAKPVVCPELGVSYEQLYDVFSKRVSVRNFSDKPLSNEEIEKAIRLAELTPTACNRQACRVHIIKSKTIIEEILQNQLGDQGWCSNADTLFIVTTISTYFGNVYERQQPYIDGGLFAMNLDMALHIQGIASCFKMYIRSPKFDRVVKIIANINENEIPIVLIFAGHYKEEITYSPLSKRNNIDYELL